MTAPPLQLAPIFEPRPASDAKRAPRAPRSALSVLFVGAWAVEWLGVDRKGRSVYVREQVEGEHPADFAQAALAAMRRAGIGKRPCIVAFGDEHTADRRVEVPALKRAELRRVLHRKAAQALKAELEDTLFAARPARSEDPAAAPRPAESSESGLQAWVVVALRRDFARDLGQRLRKHGVDVRRMVDARYARLSALIATHALPDTAQHAAGAVGSEDHAQIGTVFVAIEAQAIGIHLTHGATLVAASELAGSFERSPGLALSLLQELRGLDAHWRKLSRGGRLGRILFTGLGSAAAERLVESLESALPGVEVATLPGPGADGSTARQHALALCALQGPFDIDLSVQLPRRPALVAGLVLALGAALGIAGLVAHTELSGRLADVELRAHDLRRSSRPLSELEARWRVHESNLARVESEASRASLVLATGLPLADLLARALSILGSDAELTALTATRSGDSHTFVLAGHTHAHPLQALTALQRIERDVASIVYLEGAALRAPQLLAVNGAGAASSPFEITGRITGCSPPQATAADELGAPPGNPSGRVPSATVR